MDFNHEFFWLTTPSPMPVSTVASTVAQNCLHSFKLCVGSKEDLQYVTRQRGQKYKEITTLFHYHTFLCEWNKTYMCKEDYITTAHESTATCCQVSACCFPSIHIMILKNLIKCRLDIWMWSLLHCFLMTVFYLRHLTIIQYSENLTETLQLYIRVLPYWNMYLPYQLWPFL